MLQYLRARRLHLKIHANQDIFIDRDLFLNLGRVQNLSLDLRGSLPAPQLPVIVEEVKEDREGKEIEESLPTLCQGQRGGVPLPALR